MPPTSSAATSTAKLEALQASIDKRNNDAWFELDFDLAKARAQCEWAKTDAERIGYALGVAQSLTVLAFLLLDESKLDNAYAYAHKALDIVTAAGDPVWLPRVHCAVGGVYRMLGDTVRCIEHFEKQRAAAREAGDSYHEAVALHDIGFVLDDMHHYERALDIASAIGYQPLLTAILSNISVSLQRSGALQRARECAERSLAIARETKALVWEVQALWSLSMIHARLGDETRAYALLYEFESLGGQSPEMMALKRAQVYDALKRDQDAVDEFTGLLAQPGLGKSKRMFVLQTLAPIYARMRRFSDAYDAQSNFEALRVQMEKDINAQMLRALEASHRAELAETRANAEREHREQLARSLDELTRLNKEIGEISIRDSLSGLYSRRYLTENVARLIAEATRYATPFCVGLLDLDDFKSVNDTHGHSTGDAVIRAVADILRRELRASDIAARYGGDEFALVFPKVGVEGAEIAAERLRAAIAQHNWDGIKPGLRVTASIGLAGLAPGDSPDTVFSSADHALYDVKRSGRNGVRCAAVPA